MITNDRVFAHYDGKQWEPTHTSHTIWLIVFALRDLKIESAFKECTSLYFVSMAIKVYYLTLLL